MMAATIGPNDTDRNSDELRLRNWLWRPWYAKLWWSGVFVYWLGMLATLKLEGLAEVYRSAVGGYMNVLFFPSIVALVLSYGFLRQWLVSLPADDPDEMDDGGLWKSRKFGPSRMPRQFDPLDPASGPLWVGNTLNPTNPGYVNRAS